MKTNLVKTGLNITILLTVAAFSIQGRAAAMTPTPKLTVQEMNDALSNVVCTSAPSVEIYSENLNKVLFKAKSFETAKLFQGWNESKKSIVKDGLLVSFIKVQIMSHMQDDMGVGWIPEMHIRKRSECVDQLGGPKAQAASTVILPETAATPKVEVSNTAITGINDPRCCLFPLSVTPTESYQTGMRRFGYSRSKGRRLHAANDLYDRINSPIISVGPGTVIRGLYKFYEGTYAMEVKHQGGFIARYGEVRGHGPKATDTGAHVKMGQKIAYMAKVNSNCCAPMLHFELYSGARKGALNQNGNRYQRRKDLLNPTPYLLKWQKKSGL